jgi:hypothetical protein
MPLQRKRFRGGLRQQGSACRRAFMAWLKPCPFTFPCLR